MSRTKAWAMLKSVVIGGVAFFVLDTTWIPSEIKVILSFTGGIAVGAAAQEDHQNYWENRNTIDRVTENLNRQIGEQKSVTVMRLLTLLEEMKDKN